ncbi:hypothetical protein KQX54_004842 [Cotesia glomerata]|uniref:Uncharacterized protein n=1 Tax=Cotesia glomerata TaxID=32391 RepID=A0AAV7IUH3_COTGL|nr:hypothetical protein KQX54_004842 [Cotesia glomerata]
MISKELFDSNWNSEKNPLIIIDNVFQKQITGFLPAYPTYVLFFQSIESLKGIVNHLKKSTLWSIKSPFVIVETESRCKNTRRVLEFMWKQDLLSVYYLCNKKDLTAIFTLNPYASYAPKPWVLIEKFGDSNKNITFYSLQYSKDPELCKSITFEKTDHLKSVDIKFISFSSTYTLLTKKLHDSRLKLLLEKKLINIYHIPTYINATPILDIAEYPNLFQLTRGFIQQLVDQTHDVLGTLMPITETDSKYVDVVTYYQHEYEIFIMTKKEVYFTVINEISSDVDFVVMTIAVFVMFTIALVLINREDICEALMDSMRLVVSMGLESPLNRLAMKKNWPLKSKFDEVALETLESGIAAELVLEKRDKKKLDKKKKMNRIKAREDYDQFDYDELVFIYYFVGFLSAFGAIVYVIEIIWARCIRIHL